ncbi:uncharacterized protein MKK02DRAFT_39935 [Dioszegia hungarica]|uniref:Uncharacterized protein n=1 Tax=Dioszegia hungarica TaxID=4972 RepID=A0AA38LY78_9TREE|nr:uncharacterized protein MKK02DRAFT_39935 [Dioszegia hungarica]KAI9639613.1 hypothetical protein MKK02DRAFT_39935 [Dioszegia hungarica]
MPEALGAASKALVRPVHGRRHLQERRRNEAQELATRSTPLAHSFEIGGKAARAAYDNQEVMRHILELVDRSTLISLFRLEKAALGMVAEVVYEEIHVDSARRMNGQKNNRHLIYCASVKSLDYSPLPSTENPSVAAARHWLDDRPVRFNPKTVHSAVTKWRKRFPQLRTLRFLNPPNAEDDAYEIDIYFDRIIVHLLSRHTFDQLPPGPEWKSATISACASFTHGPGSIPVREVGQTGYIATLISINGSRAYESTKASPSQCPFGSFFACATRRAGEIGEPITEMSLPIDYLADNDNGPLMVKRVQLLAASVGPCLRTLDLHLIDAHVKKAADWTQMIATLDQVFPLLEHLILTGILPWYALGPPLDGMRSLRTLTLEAYCTQAELAEYVCRLGSGPCIYHNLSLKSARESEDFNNLVAEYRSRYLSEK